MDNTLKTQLIQALQETIQLKKEVWSLSDQLTNPSTETQNLNELSRTIEIEELQERISILTDLR